MAVTIHPFSLDRMMNAVERVRQRMLLAAAVLEKAGIPYCIAGGNAVALWVSRVDETAVRNTRDVDVLIRRDDFDRIKMTFESNGFAYRRAAGIEMFLDAPPATARDGIHLIFANEKVRPDELLANPDVSESEATPEFRVLSLPALVRIKLTAFRDKDRVHLRDLIDIGLVDREWLPGLPQELATRLEILLNDPTG